MTRDNYTPWTPQEDAHLTRHWPGSMTASEIAAGIGRRRGMVIARGIRLDLGPRTSREQRRELSRPAKCPSARWTPERKELIGQHLHKMTPDEQRALLARLNALAGEPISLNQLRGYAGCVRLRLRGAVHAAAHAAPLAALPPWNGEVVTADWTTAMGWGARNGVSMAGDDDAVLRAVNAARMRFLLPPYRIVASRWPGQPVVERGMAA